MHVRGMRLRAMHLSGHDNEASAIEEHANSWLRENAFAKIGFRKSMHSHALLLLITVQNREFSVKAHDIVNTTFNAPFLCH